MVRWSKMVLTSKLSSRLNRLKREIKVRFISEIEQKLWFILYISSSSFPHVLAVAWGWRSNQQKFSLDFSSDFLSFFLWFFSQSLNFVFLFSCRSWTTGREKMMFYNIRSCFSWGFHSAQSKAEKGHVESSFSTFNNKLLSFPSQEESCKQLVTIMWLN